MAGQDVQNDLSDLVEVLRLSGHLRENHPQLSPAHLQRPGADSAAPDRPVDGRGRQAVPVNLQKGRDGGPPFLCRDGGGAAGKQGLPPGQPLSLRRGSQRLPLDLLQPAADCVQPCSQCADGRAAGGVLFQVIDSQR